MIVFINTNVLISSLLDIESAPYQAIDKASSFPFFCITSDYCLEELNYVKMRKFSKHIDLMDKHFSIVIRMVNVVHTGNKTFKEELYVRDEKDRLVLRATLQIDADILITGDKDLLDLTITKPKIITPREFIDNY